MQPRPISPRRLFPSRVSLLSSLALLAALFAGLAAPARATETHQPTTWATATADGNPYTEGTWTNTTQGVIVTLHATDPGDTTSGSNVSGIQIISIFGSFDSSNGFPVSPGFTVRGASGTLPPITAEGSTTINFKAINKDGYISDVQSFVVQIDRTAPKTTATPSGPLGSNGWYTGPVTVTLSASDANSFWLVSGLTQTLYQLDDNGFKDYPSSGIQISEAGTHTLTFYSIDGAGNIENQNSLSNNLTVNIDRTAPQTTASLAKANAGDPNGSNGWYRGSVNVTLSATDDESGWATTNYQVDGGPVQTFVFTWTVVAGTPVPATGPPVVLVSGDGTHTITFASTDDAGNVEATKSVTVKIDTAAPQVRGTASPAPNANGWCNKPVQVTFTPSDATSGVASVTAPVTLSSDGAGQSAQGAATDNAGNSAGATVSGINIDTTPPSLTVSDITVTATSSAGANVTFTPAAADALSGLAGVVSSPASGSLFPPGATTVTTTATDNAGNQTVKTFKVTVTVETPTQRILDALQVAQTQVSLLVSQKLLPAAVGAVINANLQAIARVVSQKTVTAAQLAQAQGLVKASLTAVNTLIATSGAKLTAAQVQALQALANALQAILTALGG